eukprot:2867292-Lingulodinium_polyedra.AAC.1
MRRAIRAKAKVMNGSHGMRHTRPNTITMSSAMGYQARSYNQYADTDCEQDQNLVQTVEALPWSRHAHSMRASGGDESSQAQSKP